MLVRHSTFYPASVVTKRDDGLLVIHVCGIPASGENTPIEVDTIQIAEADYIAGTLKGVEGYWVTVFGFETAYRALNYRMGFREGVRMGKKQ
jgi:hypothetical protein